MNQKQRKQRPLLIPAHRDRAAGDEHFERTKYAELHANAPGRVSAKVPARIDSGNHRYPAVTSPPAQLLPASNRAATIRADHPRTEHGTPTTNRATPKAQTRRKP